MDEMKLDLINDAPVKQSSEGWYCCRKSLHFTYSLIHIIAVTQKNAVDYLQMAPDFQSRVYTAFKKSAQSLSSALYTC